MSVGSSWWASQDAGTVRRAGGRGSCGARPMGGTMGTECSCERNPEEVPIDTEPEGQMAPPQSNGQSGKVRFEDEPAEPQNAMERAEYHFRQGQAYKDQGNLDEAEPCFRKALDLCKETMGPKHPSTLALVNNLGLLLKDMGKLDAAEPLYQQALNGSRATLGDRHPSTVISITNYGLLLKDQGKLDEAKGLLEEAYETRKETMGENNPSTQASYNNLQMLIKDKKLLEGSGA